MAKTIKVAASIPVTAVSSHPSWVHDRWRRDDGAKET
jgi:hypothetical protein